MSRIVFSQSSFGMRYSHYASGNRSGERLATFPKGSSPMLLQVYWGCVATTAYPNGFNGENHLRRQSWSYIEDASWHDAQRHRRQVARWGQLLAPGQMSGIAHCTPARAAVRFSAPHGDVSQLFKFPIYFERSNAFLYALVSLRLHELGISGLVAAAFPFVERRPNMETALQLLAEEAMLEA
ncbi:hypothetical protein BJV78DRAFT_1351830 [Lactifluus subvellereus]|nr:hypothetical protein BJV78DRAFT_1351830 [Lactifluus subvellereus]